MAASAPCEVFRFKNDISTLSIDYNADTGIFTGVFNYTKAQREQLKVVFSLVERRWLSGGEYKDKSLFVTRHIEESLFRLSLPLNVGSRAFQLSLPQAVPKEHVPKCFLMLSYVEETGIESFPIVCLGKPMELLELTGLGPKLNVACLYRRAVRMIQQSESIKMIEASSLFRNKPKEYFSEIFLHDQGVMRPYIKDNNGDPDNPMNGRLRGLFFSASVDKRGKIPHRSPFGPQRVIVPIRHLVRNLGEKIHLYFADFYCMDLPHKSQSMHYVTIVMTQKGSDADTFCQDSLMTLPLDNPFFQIFDKRKKFRVCSFVMVELFYTEDIDLVKACKDGGAIFTTVPSSGASTPTGFPKKQSCLICNNRGHEDWMFDIVSDMSALKRLYIK